MCNHTPLISKHKGLRFVKMLVSPRRVMAFARTGSATCSKCGQIITLPDVYWSVWLSIGFWLTAIPSLLLMFAKALHSPIRLILPFLMPVLLYYLLCCGIFAFAQWEDFNPRREELAWFADRGRTTFIKRFGGWWILFFIMLYLIFKYYNRRII